MANNILKYSSKDYDSIKKDLIDAISALTTTWTSREDGDPGIVLVKLMAALGDMESYNLDKQALEYYGPTVTQRKNASRLFNLLGYKMHWYRTAKSTITLNYQAEMPEYIYCYKRVVDGEDPEDVYFDYLTQFLWECTVGGVSYKYAVFPPASANSGLSDLAPDKQIPVPQSYIDSHEVSTLRPFIDAESDFDQNGYIDTTSSTFKAHAIKFAEYATDMFNCWIKDSDDVIGLHQCLTDPQLSLGVYGNEYNSVPYSLIPVINQKPIYGVYEPTTVIHPYTPTKLPVIQGSLRSVSFTSGQIKNNRFYVPDPELDEDYMYLSYIVSYDDGTVSEVPIFIDKTANLLTVTNFKQENQSTKVYFEFNVDDFDYPYIELSSYWKDVISENAVTFRFYYFSTRGASGCITDDYLTHIDSRAGNMMVVTNLANAHHVVDENGNYLCEPGYNPQTAREAYIDSINYNMTFDTITTIYDFTRFTRRQKGVSNAFACDGQHAKDLNKQIRKVCDSYTLSQLHDILGIYSTSQGSVYTKEQLADILFNIRKITFDAKDASISGNPTDAQKFVNYGINLYPIWENYELQNSDVYFAYYTDRYVQDGVEIMLPYKLYGVYTDDDVIGHSDRGANISTAITKNLRETRIVNTVPYYAPCRVFPWRCCGTIHLTQMVSTKEAQGIIKNVVNYLSKQYAPQNMEFGRKITYMELIDSITRADSRIRYFDAGIGDKKLIDFETTGGSGINTEAYFNPISIMRYVQTFEEITTESSPYYNMICVDPNYIQVTGLIQ